MSPRLAGFAAAFAALVADQAHKHWMIYVFGIDALQPVRVTPFLDLVMVWNTGISYSWLQLHPLILLGISLSATLLLGVWMWRSHARLHALGLGLLVGGALGNAYDRWAYGAVADFFHFHIDTERWGRLSWYVFNIADVAIVAGVAFLMYEAVFTGEKASSSAR